MRFKYSTMFILNISRVLINKRLFAKWYKILIFVIGYDFLDSQKRLLILRYRKMISTGIEKKIYVFLFVYITIIMFYDRCLVQLVPWDYFSSIVLFTNNFDIFLFYKYKVHIR